MKTLLKLILLTALLATMNGCAAVGPLVANGIPHLLQGMHVGQKAAEIKIND